MQMRDTGENPMTVGATALWDRHCTPEMLEDNEQNLLRWVEEHKSEKINAAARWFRTGRQLGYEMRLAQAYDDANSQRPWEMAEWAYNYIDSDEDAEARYHAWLRGEQP